MYIFGGRTEEGADLGDLAAFRITSRRWYSFKNMGPSPSPRSGHSMTAFGTQIVVLAGEPSSAPRDANELTLVYVLDTNKIRYPNDQQIQQTPTGERVQGNRRPSGERNIMSQARGPPRDTSTGPGDGIRRQFSGSRESMGIEANRSLGPGVVGHGARALESGITNGPPSGPGSRLPRASLAQAPSGPPPPQQVPPRKNGPSLSGSRSRTPTKDNRGFGPSVEAVRGSSLDNATPPISAISRDAPRPTTSAPAINTILNGRGTPNQQNTQQQPKVMDTVQDEGHQKSDDNSLRWQSRQAAPQLSFDDDEDLQSSNRQQQQPLQSTQSGTQNNAVVKNTSPIVQLSSLQQELAEKSKEQESVLKDLEAARNRNAWYATELALARKAGYQQNSSPGPSLNERATPIFGDEEKPLIEALIAMRAQLADVQGSVESRVNAAAQEIAEVEQQRDVAVREAAFAKAKLAAHGGSQAGTPLSEAIPREVSTDDRSNDISRRLATALATQSELRTIITAMSSEIEAEKRAKELAESTAEAAQKRVNELDQLRNPGEMETLRMDLHEAGVTARNEAAQKSEAHAKMQLLEVDNEELTKKLEEALEDTRQHTAMFVSLRDAVGASSDKASILEKKLEEERAQREAIDQKLLQLRAEHEERTAELESTTRKLRDAEELVDTHANEARTHRGVVLAGLDKIGSRGTDHTSVAAEERVALMRQQVEDAHSLVRKNQADADDAAEKLRRAEERIAGLEAYQEQSSRESLTIRKQLQDAVRESQALQNKHRDVQQELESHQHDKSALSVRYNALKELLEERGISDLGRSRNLDSPGSRFDTPEQDRLHELEQKLESSIKEHEELKSSFEIREQETNRAYRDKLEQLEGDYKSAVRYVREIEDVLNRITEELTKCKTQNTQLQRELDGSSHSRSVEPEVAAGWEQERQSFRREIGEMQESVKESVSQLERQMEGVQSELYAAQEERDHYRRGCEQAQQHLTNTVQQASEELEQLKHENSILETRALDAERKVTILLDQVENSVGNYRRQSQNMHTASHHRGISTTSANGSIPISTVQESQSQKDVPSESAFLPSDHINSTNNRNSQALDSLASELEDLRSQWQDTHRNHRLSNQFDFERSPTIASPGAHEGMSDSLANRRRRLDAEEAEQRGTRTDDVDSSMNLREKATARNRTEGSAPASQNTPSTIGPPAEKRTAPM